jgi:hypothetical protein
MKSIKKGEMSILVAGGSGKSILKEIADKTGKPLHEVIANLIDYANEQDVVNDAINFPYNKNNIITVAKV